MNTKTNKVRKVCNEPCNEVSTPGFDEWLAIPPKVNGRVCVTCASPQAAEYTRLFMRKRIEGCIKRTSEFKQWLTEKFGYKYRTATLCRHMRRCEPALYLEMRKADIKRNTMVGGPSKVDSTLGRWETK